MRDFINKLPLKKAILGSLPFLVLLLVYLFLAAERHQINPDDKLLPLPSQIYQGILWCFTPGTGDTESNLPIIIADTYASLKRLLIGLSLSSIIAVGLALLMQNFELIRLTLHPLILFFAKIPSVALLPILLLWIGINENSKISLVILGLTPYMCLHLLEDLKRNQHAFQEIVLSMNLPLWQQFLYVDLPLLRPSFVHQIQTSLGPAWLFLLIAEVIGAKHGLGYRIFVIRRFLRMDVIIIYVLWITFLSVVIYSAFNIYKRRFTWYSNE